jgi:hypothetical protein
MEAEEQPRQAESTKPGWYSHHNGKRYHDGNDWTDHYAYVAPSQISYVSVAFAVAFGVVIGWLAIWIGAQAAPDTFYVPVKFVVEELPTFGR